MDFIKFLQNQQRMYDPHMSAQKLMGGFRNASKPYIGGYDPTGADISANNTPLIDPAKLNQGGYEPPMPRLQEFTPETNNYGNADLQSDYTNLTPMNNITRAPEQTYQPINTNIGPSLLGAKQSIDELMNRYNGDYHMALIAQQMSPELVEALVQQYGADWKNFLSDHLKQLIR